MAIRVQKLSGFTLADKPVYFDSEFVRVGPAATGVPLHEFVQTLTEPQLVLFLDTMLECGHGAAIARLITHRHVERPTMQQHADVDRVELTIRNQSKTVAEFVNTTYRLNKLLKAGLLRVNPTGALVIATKPGE